MQVTLAVPLAVKTTLAGQPTVRPRGGITAVPRVTLPAKLLMLVRLNVETAGAPVLKLTEAMAFMVNSPT